MVNFLSSYKSPSTKDSEYLAKLEDFILTLDPAEPIFIIGDLNMDLRSDEGIELKNFLINNDLKNFVNTHTRIERRFYIKRQKWIVSKTLIDVVIHNQNKIIETAVIGCPFSDHCFVISSLEFNSTNKQKSASNTGRSLTDKGIIKLTELLNNISKNFTFSKSNKDIDEIFKCISDQWRSALDSVAPIKEFKIKPKEVSPWEDGELLEKRIQRDFYYSKFKETSTHKDHLLYTNSRREFQSLNRLKMKEYFASKNIGDFKNNKLYWEFYSSSIKIKSCKIDDIAQNVFLHNNEEISDPIKIGNLFNTFFTSLSSTSFASETEIDHYINKTFRAMKSKGFIKLKTGKFKFTQVTESHVELLINKLNETSGAGITGIPSK